LCYPYLSLLSILTVYKASLVLIYLRPGSILFIRPHYPPSPSVVLIALCRPPSSSESLVSVVLNCPHFPPSSSLLSIVLRHPHCSPSSSVVLIALCHPQSPNCSL